MKAKKAARSAGTFLAGVGTTMAALLAAAEERRQQEQESLESIQEAIQAHIDEFGTSPTVSSPRECTFHTAFWDCEDPDCYYHKAEKNRRGIGTPTRNFK